ncbi:hypothetical protein D3C80_1556290 [compost metagenome]
MIDHNISHQFHAAPVQLLHKLLKVLHRAEVRINRLIIGHVVTVIILRRDIDRLQPDNINAKLLQVIQLLCKPFNISCSVACRILKALRVYLIHRGPAPPFRIPGLCQMKHLQNLVLSQSLNLYIQAQTLHTV